MNSIKTTAPTPKQIEMIQQAVALHRLGKLDEAAAQYIQLLHVLPNNVTLLTNLGISAIQKGNFEDGIRILDQSLEIEPNQLNALYNRAGALQYLNRLDEAVSSYDRVIALNPNLADAYHNRGNALRDLKRLDDALVSYDHALSLNPSYAQAYYDRGNTLLALKRLDAALTSYDRAIALHPDYVDAYINRGNVLYELNRLDAAAASYDRAIALNPNYAEAHCNRANVLQALNRWDDALASYDRAIALKPDYAEAYLNRGKLLQALNRWEDALASYDCAISLDPHSALAHNYRGYTLHDLNRLDEALVCYDRAIAINPSFAEAYWNKSLVKLTKGECQEGWSLYEWRWKIKPPVDFFRIYPQPKWLGEESLVNKRILIYPEQGLGDYIQFVRYAALVEQLGANVILETPSALMQIAASLEGQFTLIEKGSGQPLPDFDYHCPIMSLPLAFKTALETIPAKIPYIYANQEKSKVWAERLGQSVKPRVGLVWQGGFRQHQPEKWAVNEKRNIKLTEFYELKDLDVAFYSLQKGQAAEAELHELQASQWDGPNIYDFTAQIHDFSDTAALIDNLDLILSVDTSTAHLAAAMGKQVWILNRFDTCWRWMLDRDDSPWYPTVTLFRQSEPGNWSGVIERVKTRLVEFF